jgi:hypothetical protein
MYFRPCVRKRCTSVCSKRSMPDGSMHQEVLSFTSCIMHQSIVEQFRWGMQAICSMVVLDLTHIAIRVDPAYDLGLQL